MAAAFGKHTTMPTGIVTFLFTDIEGSSHLWEREPVRMPPALAQHDALARGAVERHRGTVVKMIGDGMHAAFVDPLDAVNAALELQQALGDPAATEGLPLRVRCGIHAGNVEFRDNDYFGNPVNRAARIMGTAQGGQVLLSNTVAVLVRDHLPEGVSLRNLGAVRLRDLTSPERIYQVMHPKLRQDFPALRSLEATPNNLLQQATTFVGRQRELAELREALCATHLLTLVGAGGIGKTRLSLQVAAEVLDDYPDGVWFVELAPLNDERLVPQAVASVLGVKEDAGRPVTEALVRHVADRRLLLVLDNCEHLVQACAALAEQLLKSGPQLRILASSREPLRVSGEASFPVPTLAVPASQESVAVETLRQYPAVRLFVDRAAAVLPTFGVTDHNASAIAEICRRLDGMPLAIELAAARVRALSVQNIAARLNDRFDLLTGGDRTALPRQQTLRALVDWSYDLLSEKERVLFRRLAVFGGGWTLEAAEAVCSGDDVGEGEVLDLLANLVDRSVVTLDPETGRYGLLQTIRQYAQERLNESGEDVAVRTRHLAYYLALAETAKPHFFGPEEGRWLVRIDLEREDLLAAHAWCDRTESDAESGLRLVNAMKAYWFNRGLLSLGYQVTSEALRRTGAQSRSPARGLGLFGAGQLCCFMGSYAEGRQHLTESLAIARELGDSARIAAALQPLAIACLGVGDLAMARNHCEEALVMTRALADKHQLASAINAMGQLDRMERKFDAAQQRYAQVVALGRELGDYETIAVGLLNLAMVSIERGSIDPVPAILLEVLQVADQVGSKPAGQSALEVSVGLAVTVGECKEALRFFGAAEAQTGSTGLRRDPSDEAFLKPQVLKARVALGPSVAAAAEMAGRGLPYAEAITEVREWLARHASGSVPSVLSD